MRRRFGDFVLDSATRQLLERGEERHLEPKAFALLDLLLGRRPAAIAKAELQETLWPETFVSESSLTRLVAQIREALGEDSRRARFIRTVHGFGYAFSGDASDEPSARSRTRSGAFHVVWGERAISLRAGENVLGRDEGATVHIDAPGVSRRHAIIVVAEGRAMLEDLGSKNGTYLLERRLDGPSLLKDGDTFRLGHHLLHFRSSRPTVSTRTDAD